MGIRREFWNSLKCGTGKAVIILQENPNLDFSNLILKAAVKKLGYDAQCETNRANYLSRMIELSSRRGCLIKKILRALIKDSLDSYSLEQLYSLAGIFARNGLKAARSAIYKRFMKPSIRHSEWCGQKTIISIDGFKGLAFVAQKRGAELQNDPTDWEDSMFVEYFQTLYPDCQPYNELMKLSVNDENIKRYLEEVLKSKSRATIKNDRPRCSYQIAKDAVLSKRMIPVSPKQLREISEADFILLANDFQNEKDIFFKERFLRIFSERKFPLSYDKILEIAQGTNPRRSRLVEFACDSLKFFSDSKIRNFAIQKITTSRNPDTYLPLLVSNYKAGDSEILESLAKRVNSDHLVHSLGCKIIEIFENNRTTECFGPLKALYGKMNCSIHRYDLVKILFENHVLTYDLCKELQYDCDEDIQLLSQTLLQKYRDPKPL